MTDLKKQLEQWQSKQEPSLSEKTPAESLSQPPLKTPAKKKDIDEIEPTELSREDRLLFLETVVQMGGAQEKTKLDNALKEQAASQEIESWHVTESELFQKEALDFDYADIKANKSPEAHKKPSRPLVAKRILKGLEEPSVTCDLHRLDREQASQKVNLALSQCYQFDRQVLLIIHGKGKGLLRDQVIADLNANLKVAEHFVAPAHLGGEGARVIILKKKDGRT